MNRILLCWRICCVWLLFSGTAPCRQALADEPPPLQHVVIEKIFAPFLDSHPALATEGGAAVVQIDAKRYFIAVGVTSVHYPPSAAENLRQLRVGLVQAQKAAVTFLESTTVVAEERLTEKTTITNHDGHKTAEVSKTLDEVTAATVRGSLHGLPQVGSWLSADGTLFFLAIGKELYSGSQGD